MNYLHKKRLALMMNKKFRGYMRTVSGYPLTLTDCMADKLVSLSVTGSSEGVGERTINLFNVNGDINRRWNGGTVVTTQKNYKQEDNKINVYCSATANHAVGQLIDVEIGKTYTYSAEVDNLGTTSAVRISIQYTDASTYIKQIAITNKGVVSFTPSQNKILLGFNKDEGDSGNTGTVIKNVMFIEGEYTAETMPGYEPYGYKIPLTVSGEAESSQYNIYTDSPLYGNGGEEYEVPAINIYKGTNTITAGTTVQPANMEVSYYADKEE